MSPRKMNPDEYIGRRFGKLVVVGYDGMRKGRQSFWNCVCDCGKCITTAGCRLRNGTCQSCGCLKGKKNNKFNLKHNMSKTRLYREWARVVFRGSSENWNNAHRYIKRGITVCDEWKKFEPFMEWALANGYDDGLTIDRIDNDKGYSPDNCRWISHKMQQRNKGNTIYVEYRGEKKPLVEWVEELNVDYRLVYARLRRGWKIEDAFERPLRNS